jgi:hypothetical protein
MGMSVPELTESQNPRQMIDFPVSCAEPFLEPPGEVDAGELRALVGVEYLRLGTI